MYTLNVEKRNESLKAKQLRKSGKVPASVYGGDLKETLLVQTSLGDAIKLLKSKSKGARVMLELDSSKLSVQLKEISCNAVSGQVENLSFQKLQENEVVNSTVKIVLINKDKTQVMAQQLLNEIPYRGLPSELVEKIEIDVSEIKAGNIIKIEDLSFAKNEKIEILVPLDTMVLNMVRSFNSQPESPESVED